MRRIGANCHDRARSPWMMEDTGGCGSARVSIDVVAIWLVMKAQSPRISTRMQTWK